MLITLRCPWGSRHPQHSCSTHWTSFLSHHPWTGHIHLRWKQRNVSFWQHSFLIILYPPTFVTKIRNVVDYCMIDWSLLKKLMITGLSVRNVLRVILAQLFVFFVSSKAHKIFTRFPVGVATLQKRKKSHCHCHHPSFHRHQFHSRPLNLGPHLPHPPRHQTLLRHLLTLPVHSHPHIHSHRGREGGEGIHHSSNLHT